MSSDSKITAVLMLEVIGRPPEHLVETLKGMAEAIDKEQGVSVLSKNIKEPIPLKEQQEFYTTFAEIEVEVEEMMFLAMLMFKYMPAHIEIVSPEIVAISNNAWSEILSELTRRLHAYDEVVRVTLNEKDFLYKKIQELQNETTEEVKPEKNSKKTKKTITKKSKAKK